MIGILSKIRSKLVRLVNWFTHDDGYLYVIVLGSIIYGIDTGESIAFMIASIAMVFIFINLTTYSIDKKIKMLERDAHITASRLNRLEDEEHRKNSILNQQISILDQEIKQIKRQLEVLSSKQDKDCS